MKSVERKTFKSDKECYRKSTHFDEIYEFLNNCFNNIDTLNLSEVNIFLIKKICEFLKIKTKFLNSCKIVKLEEDQSPSNRLLEIIMNRKAKIYYTGPAKNYLTQYCSKNRD